MKRTKRIFLRTLLASITAAILLTALAPQGARAETLYWVTDGSCDIDDWNEPTCWTTDPLGVDDGVAYLPGGGDTVLLTQSDGAIRTVTYLSGTDPTLGELRIDATNGGTITLSQSQDDLSADNEYIGYEGIGIFDQSGGTNTATYLYLGFYSTGDGTYTLSSGDLVADLEDIGVYGTGTFTQSGGTNTITYGLSLGYNSGSSGTYTLSGGTLTVGGDIIDGDGTGTLNIDGGTLTMGGGISGDIGVDTFRVGYGVGTTGSHTLGAGQTLSADHEIIGGSGTGAFTQSGGTNTIAIDLYLGLNSGSSGTYTLSGGTFSADHEIIGGSGTGAFTQSGGTNTITYDLYLGLNPGSSGTYTLSGGTLFVVDDIIDGAGTGTLNLDGGTLTVIGGDIGVDYFNVGYVAGTTGSHTLGGFDTITANNEHIGYDGTGSFTQTGGTNTVTNTLTIATNPGSTGTYDLQNGTLTVANTGGTGEIINNDTFNYSGGTLNVDTFTNNAAFNLSGTGTRTVNGNVTNTGTVKTTDTEVSWTGAFTNLGAYVSDPSDNYFVNLDVGDDGYLVGGAWDNFYISGNFTNSSTQNLLWDTVDAYLGFTGTDASHNLELTGLDFGADLSGYTENFAWGTLSLADNNTLSLFDGNGDDVGELYLGEILGLAFSSDGGTITNITGIDGLNIYYNALLNTGLGGSNYSLTGGGMLLAINDSGGGTTSVPEPSTMLLLGTGLVGLAFVRRLRRRA